jgi:hypothetical protein
MQKGQEMELSQASHSAGCSAEPWPETARCYTKHSSESRQESVEPGKVLHVPLSLAAQVQGLERPPGALGARPVRMGLGAAFTQARPILRTGAVL